MKTEHRRIAVAHDRFAEDGYAEALAEVEYAPPKVVPAILQKLQIKQSDLEVLDLGCGPGNLKDFTQFDRYIGVDLSPSMLGQAGGKGYQELIEADILEYLESQSNQSVDAIVALSCTYFLNPEALDRFLSHLDRVARVFWLITLDGVTEAVQKVYKEEMGILTYNHLGNWVGEPDYTEEVRGWYSRRTRENIPMQFILKLPLRQKEGGGGLEK